VSADEPHLNGAAQKPPDVVPARARMNQ